MIGQPLYKSSAVAGHSWHEWMKWSPSDYRVYRIEVDGSATNLYQYSNRTMAMKATRTLNGNEKYTKPEDIEYMALEFYYTDEWKNFATREQIRALQPRRVAR